jgi:siroheme synthase-like protein
LVIAATGDSALNEAVSVDAAAARILCNVVDKPALCAVQVPAVLRRGLLQIAVSTGGASPALAGKIRRQLEEIFPETYEQLLDALLDLRKHYQQKYPEDGAHRRELLQSFVNSAAPDLLLKSVDAEAFSCELERWKSR